MIGGPKLDRSSGLRQPLDMSEPELTSADLHERIQKQVLNAVFETLASTKMDWDQIAPFLDIVRSHVRSDFEHSARIGFHSVRAEGDQWVDAEEAFLGLAVADRDTGQTWLSQTWWVSDIVLADRERAPQLVAALERSLKKIKEGLEDQTETAGDESLT